MQRTHNESFYTVASEPNWKGGGGVGARHKKSWQAKNQKKQLYKNTIGVGHKFDRKLCYDDWVFIYIYIINLL